MVFYSKNIKKFKTFVIFIISSLVFIHLPLKTLENTNKNNNNELNSNPKKNRSISSPDYLLGSGDTLFIKFEEIEIFSGAYTINPEGNLLLPEINNFYANNKTIDELQDELLKKYDDFIKDPSININVIRYRPVDIYLIGEVKKPGLYTLNYEIDGNTSVPFYPSELIASRQTIYNSEPRIFNALKLAEGVTNNADLSNIKIVRKNSQKQGGGEVQASINLLTLFIEGDQSQNIRLYDGDKIFIPKSKEPIKDQILAINRSNLGPDKISVFVTGNVDQAGLSSLKKGSSLIQAIASRGGKKLMTGSIELTRFKNDGTTKKDVFRYNPKAKIGSRKNPVLVDGDIVHVNKTLLGSTAEVIKDVGNPLLGAYGIYSIFDD